MKGKGGKDKEKTNSVPDEPWEQPCSWGRHSGRGGHKSVFVLSVTFCPISQNEFCLPNKLFETRKLLIKSARV